MHRLTGLTNILRSRLLGAKNIREVAISIDLLEDAFTEEAPKPAMLPGMPERITACVPGHGTVEAGRSMLTASVFKHERVERFTLRDCLVHEGGVEFAGGLWPGSGAWRDRFPRGPIEEIVAGSYCMRPVSQQYFGHWLRDACSTALLADKKETLFLDKRPDWPDAAHYASVFGLQTRLPAAAHVSTLRLYSDFSQGWLKRKRYAVLRERMRKELGEPLQALRPVYLRRSSSNTVRTIENEAGLCDRLSAEGFEIMDLFSNSFAERYALLANASIVVTLEGSHLNHAYYAMKPGSALLPLIPGNRFSAVHRGVAHAMGMQFGCVVMEAGRTGSVVNPDEVLRTVELLA